MNNPFPQDRIISGALCYIIQDNCVLMQRRNRPPHLGRWTAPGGKLELGESPDECVVREIREETGLTVLHPQLRGIVSVNDIAYPIYWLLFIYRATQTDGTPLLGETREGELSWIALGDLEQRDLPRADRAYLPYVLAEGETIFRAKFVYETPEVCHSEQFYT